MTNKNLVGSVNKKCLSAMPKFHKNYLALHCSPVARGGSVCTTRSPKLLSSFMLGTTSGVKKTWVDFLNHGSNSGNRDLINPKNRYLV